MAKVSGAYASVTGGVSEQVAQDRRPGQHEEQINMVSDPVRGLARRHGSRLQHEIHLSTMSAEDYAIMVKDTLRQKVFPFFVDGVEYDLIYRTEPATAVDKDQSFMWAFNKKTRQFIPVEFGTHPNVASLKTGGLSSAVNVGKYIFLAGKTIVPTYTGVDDWAAPSNVQKMVVWFRGGAYSKTYTVTLTKASDNSKVSKSYKTKSSSYPELLDTSGIPSSDPDYDKKINDATWAYQSAVNAWIGEAAEDITPQNIANKLAELFTADGIVCQAENGTLCFDDPLYKEVSAEDGGDGTLVRAVGAEVSNIDLLSAIHWAGKVVKVRPKRNDGTDALYLVAEAKDGSAGWTDVTWKEVAGYVMTPSSPFCIGTVVAGTLYIGGNPSDLSTISGDATPSFRANEVGDEITSPPPYFMNKKIDYLGLFQDRLIIGSGAVLFFSRPGDYFNWWRVSVLSVDDRDPVELYALGSEDDTIMASTTYDRNLVLFGKRKQYTVNGRQPLVPNSASIVIMSAHEDAVDALPVNSGNFVFYTTGRNSITSAHQIQMGTLADSPESYEITQQLDQYIKGDPIEIMAVTSPNVIFVRTSAVREQIFVYGYLDTPAGDQRLFDSWSRWTWKECVGQLIGIGREGGDLLFYMLRHGKDINGDDAVWIAAEAFTLDSSLSNYPYLDSLRRTTTVTDPTIDSFIHDGSADVGDIWVGFDASNPDLAFLGTDITNLVSFEEQYPTTGDDSWTGFDYEAFVTPTNPYVRDSEGKAIINGRLTITKVVISIADTAGFRAYVTTTNGTTKMTDFSGRTLGRISNRVGRQPVVTTSATILIGKETRECSYSMYAKPMLPFTITAIEWTGQYFNNARRV